MDYYIEGVRPQDWEEIRIWRNAQTAILRQNEYITKEQQEKYSKAYYESQASYCAPQILYSFFVKDQFCQTQYDWKLIGYGGLVHIDWTLGVAEISFLMGPPRKLDLLSYSIDYMTFLKLLRDATDKLGLRRWRFETKRKTGDETRDIHIAVAKYILGPRRMLTERMKDYTGEWIQEFDVR